MSVRQANRREEIVGVVEHGDAGMIVKDVFGGVSPAPSYSLEAPVPTSLPTGAVVRVRVGSGETSSCALAGKGVLAKPGSALAASYGLACALGLDPAFPCDVMEEVRSFLASPGLQDPDLQDLTSMPFVTIDNEGSRDLDQAMCIVRRAGDAGGGWTLYYALADGSFYCRPGTALWREACKRGASFYLPGFAVPMLPREFSEGLVSLNEGMRRRALVFVLEVDAQGTLVASKVVRAVINSRRKLSYEGVQRFHDLGLTGDLAGHDFTETLVLLGELGKARIARDRARNVVKFRRAEFSVSADDPGASFSLVCDSRLEVEKWNEQCSLLCNICGAKMLQNDPERMQGIWRVHLPPPDQRLEELSKWLDALGSERGLGTERYHWNYQQGEPLASFLEKLPEDRSSRAIHRAAMLCNLAAEIEQSAGPHFGVGADSYARFSAPMRQIEGIFLHRELLQSLGFGEHSQADYALRDEVVDTSRKAKKLQAQITKASNRLAIDAVFSGDLSWPTEARPVRRGTVLGVGPDKQRIYVELDNPPVEVKVYLAPLRKQTGRDFVIDKRAVSVMYNSTKILVGDVIGLRVVRGSLAEEPWILEPLVLSGTPIAIGTPSSVPPPQQPHWASKDHRSKSSRSDYWRAKTVPPQGQVHIS